MVGFRLLSACREIFTAKKAGASQRRSRGNQPTTRNLSLLGGDRAFGIA
jgi:hypothetical protein